MRAGTCLCSPAVALPRRTPFSTTFCSQALSLPFWPPSLEICGWSRAQGVSLLSPGSAAVPFAGLLMSKFLLHVRGAGLGQGALPLAVNEYFQNRALTSLKESVLAALPWAHPSGGSWPRADSVRKWVVVNKLLNECFFPLLLGNTHCWEVFYSRF